MSDKEKATELLLVWYRRERRILPWREDPTPYHVWISEIMLQQTRVEVVIDYYHRFLLRFPDVKTLAEADLNEVLTYWQGLGYYRRCTLLHRCAQQLMEKYNGKIPGEFGALLSLPGFGRYTAAAVMSIGFGQPYPAVDGNVLRVMMRFLNDEACIDEDKVKSSVEKELFSYMPVAHCSDFTQALMDLGATVCLPNATPKCGLCPWEELCQGKSRSDMLPVRKEKKERKKELRTVFVLSCDGEIGLKKRSPKGLLANMWEFPNIKGQLSLEEAAKRYDEKPRLLGETKQIFTHIEWYLTGYYWELKKKPVDTGLTWIKKEEIENYAIPSAFSYFKKGL